MRAHTSYAAPKDGARHDVCMMVVELGPRGQWIVSRVLARDRTVIQRQIVGAAPLRNPGTRCIQRLGSRLLSKVGPASSILFLIDRLAIRDRLTPSLLAAFPVPILSASASVALVHNSPPALTRFAFLDFYGRGSLALVKRSEDGRICDYSSGVVDIQTYLGVDRSVESDSGDMLVDALERARPGDRATVATELLRAIRPMLDSACSFGYEGLVCASRLFSNPGDAAAFLEVILTERSKQVHIELLNSNDERAIAGARYLSTAQTGPGAWITNAPASRTLSVVAPRNVEYQVTHVDSPLFDMDEPALAQLLGLRPAMFVIDRVVEGTYGADLRRYAARHLNCADICSVEGNEASKTWPQVEEICARAIGCGLRRDGVIVAVGGGITLDMTGVAASLYRRGVRYARIPTTLVGMVDVCVGIKQGINFGAKKNILGTFYPPFGGINDLTFLKSVPRRQLACGISEIAKMAIVRDPFLFELLEAYTGRLLASHFQTPHRAAEQIVIRAELAMMTELQPNLYEEDLRRFVDFGHSFSPGLESASHYELHHGEAVGIDMMLCTALAVRRGLCDEAAMRRIAGIYAVAGLPLRHELCDPKFLCDSLVDVRIHRGGNLNLVVPTGIGSATFVQEVTPDEIAVALGDIDSVALDVAAPEERPCVFLSG